MRAVIRVASNVVISKQAYETLQALGIGVIWSNEARPNLDMDQASFDRLALRIVKKG